MHRSTQLGSAALLLAAGCSSYTVTTPETPPLDARAPVRPDAAEICVLRLPSTGPVGGAVTQVVRDNERLAGATSGAGYFCYAARPGRHRLTSEVGITSETIDLVVSKGERRFVQHSFRTREGVSLAPMPEQEALAALPGLRFQQLADAPESAPSVAGAAAPLPDASSAAPVDPRRRPAGILFGGAVGLGLASTRTYPATSTTPGLAALASFWVGLPATDFAVFAPRIDVASLNGTTIADVALHLAVFPGASSSGPVADFMLFGDGGVRIPTSSTMASGVTVVGRLGVGWERWKLGSFVLGPFLCGQVGRGGGEADAAVLAGVGGSLYARARAP